MVKIELQFFGGRGGSSGVSSGGGSTLSNGAPALDKNLINRANTAGTVVDYGDSTSRQYQKNTDEINNMDLTDTEKQEAYNELHNLTEDQLRAEAEARTPYSMGVGPARFNQGQMRRSADKAVNARNKTESFMDGLRKEQSARTKQRETQALSSALKEAIAGGALSVTVGGKTYTRKSTRSKTFTLE